MLLCLRPDQNRNHRERDGDLFVQQSMPSFQQSQTTICAQIIPREIQMSYLRPVRLGSLNLARILSNQSVHLAPCCSICGKQLTNIFGSNIVDAIVSQIYVTNCQVRPLTESLDTKVSTNLQVNSEGALQYLAQSLHSARIFADCIPCSKLACEFVVLSSCEFVITTNTPSAAPLQIEASQ